MTDTAYGRDHEVVQRLRPEPMTAEEKLALGNLDDTDFEIFRHKMHMIALEGKETTMKLGASTAMRFGDVAFGIFTAQGDLAVCATGIYHHAVLGQIPLKYIVKHWVDDKSVGVREGDSFFYNDPFYAGVHNADMGLAVPVFAQGKLVCFIGAAVHTGEAGGNEPGGTSPSARSKFDEGLLVPPIKIGENYQLKEDLLHMLAAMTRDPRTMILDIKARLAAVRIAQRRVLEVVSQRGASTVVGGLRRILHMTSEAAQRKVASLNDGVFRQPRFLDSVGTEPGLTRIYVTLIKKGSRITIDFEGTSPAALDRPINSFFQGMIGLACVYLCGWLFHDLPANNGLLEAIDWRFPENSMVNAQGDTSTSLAPLVQVCFTQGMFLCGARMTYSADTSRAVAAWYSGFAIPVFGGINQKGEPIADITPEINATGAGARFDADGVDAAGAFFATMSDCGDVEATEEDRPLLYLFRNLFSGSYGHGKFRGGAGVGVGLMVHGVPWLALGAMGAGARFPTTLGVFGGYGVPPTFVRYVKGSNQAQLMAAGSLDRPTSLEAVYRPASPESGEVQFSDVNMTVRPFSAGDTYYIAVGGGGGFGDALERDAQAVARDVRNGLLEADSARRVYGVVLDGITGQPDEAATRERREQVRRERLARGRPYREFLKYWETQRPPAAALRYYGDYPDTGRKQPPLRRASNQ